MGLTRFANRAHLVRATLEAIAFQSREVVEAMAEDGGRPLSALKADGGASVNDFLMQFQADVLGIPVVRPVVRETTALGAAYAAGLAVGAFDSTDSLRRLWRAERTFEPAWSGRPTRDGVPRLEASRRAHAGVGGGEGLKRVGTPVPNSRSRRERGDVYCMGMTCPPFMTKLTRRSVSIFSSGFSSVATMSAK